MNLVDLPKTPIQCENLIGGALFADAPEQLDVMSPQTGSIIGHVPMSTAEHVNRAVTAAAVAQRDWQEVPLKERTQVLFEFRRLLLANQDLLANSAAREAGKTVEEARAGVLKGVEVLEFALAMQNLDDGGVLEVSRGVTCEVKREPLGVCVGITPFNFPAMVPLWMIPISVTLGNSFVLKPSEKVPMTSCELGRLAMEAGYPPGVLSIVHGGRPVVEALVDHPDTAAIAFVGSTPVARAVYARAAASGKRALCLGGAKNHLIVVPDADPEVTVDGVVKSFTGCAGQRCMAASLLVAVGDVDPLIDQIVERTRKLALGTDMGAIIDRAARDRLSGAIERAKAEGAEIRVGGAKPKAPEGCDGGYWLSPTIIDRAKPDSEAATQELFGPVLTVVRVDTLDEAVNLGSGNKYGNATSVFTTNGAVARYVADRAEAGMVGVNIGVPVPREPFSFGGTKESRFGHGDITGRGAVELWSQLKKISTKWALHSDATWMS